MELQQLIREIHWIEWQLRVFEDRYGLLSQDFFQAMGLGRSGHQPPIHANPEFNTYPCYCVALSHSSRYTPYHFHLTPPFSNR